MLVVSADFETWNTDSINVGIPNYVKRLRILCMAWHIVGELTQPQLWWPGQLFPEAFRAALDNGAKIAGWNSIQFERLVWRERAVPDHGFPPLDDDVWLDTMHLAAAANLPRSLDGCAKAVGAPFQKDSAGHKLMLRVTNGNRTPWPPKKEDLVRLGEYCIQDVLTEEATALRLPAWPAVAPWHKMRDVDRRINDRGVLIDVELVQGLVKAAALETKRLDAEMAKLTKGQVPATTTIEALKGWLRANGVELPLKVTKEDPEDQVEDDDDSDAKDESDKVAYRLRKSDIADLLARDDVPEHCRLALEMRAEAAKASARKLHTILRMVGPDGRLRAIFALMGAQATGRWSAPGPQFHNLVRDTIGKPDDVAEQNGLDPKRDKALVARLCQMTLDTAIAAGRSGDPDLIAALFTMTRRDLQGRTRVEGVLPFVSRMARRTLASPAGLLFHNGDYSNIEARIPVWLAGQEDVVQMFADGKDLYRRDAAPVYGMTPEQLNSDQRQTGKVMRLSLGFAGGAGAFVLMAMNYGLRLSKDAAVPLVSSFRSNNAMLVKFWDANLWAAIQAVMMPGREFFVPPKGLLSWRMQDNCLFLRLPSSRCIRYWAPRVQRGYWPDGREKEMPDLTVLVMKGKVALRRTLWRGLAVQNPTQAIAADLLANGLANMEDAGLPVVMHVHDSIADEVLEDKAEELLPVFKQCMLAAPPWAQGLPIAADVHISARFG